jgi:hypothetical protein
MKCVVCKRALTRPAFTMPGKGELLMWGPKCGADLIRNKKLAEKEAASMKTTRVPRYRDGLTADLFEGAAA